MIQQRGEQLLDFGYGKERFDQDMIAGGILVSGIQVATKITGKLSDFCPLIVFLAEDFLTSNVTNRTPAPNQQKEIENLFLGQSLLVVIKDMLIDFRKFFEIFFS